MQAEEIRNKLIDKGLKVTPQRIAIFEAIVNLNNHPTADKVIEYIRKNHPNISVATVYKVLDALVKNRLIIKVKSENESMRYDAVMESHHHIYCSESDRIEDYHDHELTELLEKYFEKKRIPGFRIADVKLQIIGKFINSKVKQ